MMAQMPDSAMERMVDEYLAGAEVVYGVRSKRDTDTFFKRFTAQTFYKLLNKLKRPEQTIINASHFEKATYSIQLEENQTEINNDYTPIGLVYYPETDDLVKIENHAI